MRYVLTTNKTGKATAPIAKSFTNMRFKFIFILQYKLIKQLVAHDHGELGAVALERMA